MAGVLAVIGQILATVIILAFVAVWFLGAVMLVQGKRPDF